VARKAAGLPGVNVSIQWGVVADVGFVAEQDKVCSRLTTVPLMLPSVKQVPTSFLMLRHGVKSRTGYLARPLTTQQGSHVRRSQNFQFVMTGQTVNMNNILFLEPLPGMHTWMSHRIISHVITGPA
jgi:hypothetical protein